MSSRCLNAIKTCSKFKVNSKLLAQGNNIKIIKSTPYKINSSNYGTWGSLGKSHNNLKIIAAGVTGFGIYTSYQIYRKQSFLSSVVNPVFHVLALEEDNKKYRDYLNVEPTRKIRSSTDKSKYKLTFFQFQSCPFCCKVRAFLDFHGFSYDLVEVNSFTRKELKWTQGYKKVPILMVRNEQTGEIVMLKDSSAIISCLQTSFEHPEQALSSLWEAYPTIEETTKKGKVVYEVANRYNIMYGENRKAPEDFLEVKKWREWTDNFFVHLVSPNLYRTPSEAHDTFKIFSKVGEWEENFTWFERTLVVVAGSSVMYFIGKRLKKRHKLSSDVRQELYAACDEWVRAVKKANKSKKGAKFMGGLKPNLADLSMYGVVNAMEGTMTFNDMLEHSKIGEWFYGVKSEVACKAGQRVGLTADKTTTAAAVAVAKV